MIADDHVHLTFLFDFGPMEAGGTTPLASIDRVEVHLYESDDYTGELFYREGRVNRVTESTVKQIGRKDRTKVILKVPNGLVRWAGDIKDEDVEARITEFWRWVETN